MVSMMHQQKLRDLGDGVMMHVKVMTDEQLETLQKQIAVYASISEKLVEMHKTLTVQQDHPGVRLGNTHSEPMMMGGGHKISCRQRWAPTAMQLQILESMYEENGAPNKQKMKDITAELSHYGQISEANVYNWFQNRRARSKRKQQNNNQPQVKTEVHSSKDNQMSVLH